jgi:hypothetical protein
MVLTRATVRNLIRDTLGPDTPPDIRDDDLLEGYIGMDREDIVRMNRIARNRGLRIDREVLVTPGVTVGKLVQRP